MNTEWIKDLNVAVKRIKLLKGNIRKNLHDLRSGNGFLAMMLKEQQRQQQKTQIIWISSELKTFCIRRLYQRNDKTYTTGEYKYLQIIYVI